ncbi:pyridoxamine 5'-phosphate oxidase [Aestuariimicrobium sp. Y1814]|uniref:pyridoxamine 5'-phosphate oxidase n=1 Tax=Aestuariimicrobium sp. Y1814 TaxID=3418742 RepID=UPI003DA70C5C
MSIEVQLDELAAVVARFGSAVLVTLPAGQHARLATVDPVVEGHTVVVRGARASALANVETNPRVTIYWPAVEHHGFALIVDGTGLAQGPDLRVTPDHAVLHRPREHADGPPAPVPGRS